MPSTIPNLLDGGYKNEAATKVYLELAGHAFGLTVVRNLDVSFEAKVRRGDYMVRYGSPREPHVLEVKKDLRLFLNSIGPVESSPFEGIRTDEEASEPHNLSWPSIVFAGTDSHGDREEFEREYPGAVIIADEDAPKECPTFSEFQQSLARAFEAYRAKNDTEANGTTD